MTGRPVTLEMFSPVPLELEEEARKGSCIDSGSKGDSAGSASSLINQLIDTHFQKPGHVAITKNKSRIRIPP